MFEASFEFEHQNQSAKINKFKENGGLLWSGGQRIDSVMGRFAGRISANLVYFIFSIS